MEFYTLIILTLFIAFVNASVSLTLIVWMQPRMILAGYRFWLAKNLLPESEAKEKILADISFAKETDPFIKVYLETKSLGFLTAENWEILNGLELGKPQYFKDKFGVLSADINRYLIEKIFSFELFELVWGVCPKEDFEGRAKTIDACHNRMINLALETSFFYKPLGGCLHCFHVWILPLTYSLCVGFYSQYFKLTFWLIPVFFASVFISGCLVNLFDKPSK